MRQRLKFSEANAKLKHLPAILAFTNKHTVTGELYSFDLPAGHTCPGAKYCKSRAVKTSKGWRIKDGPDCICRCYSASQEVVLPALRRARQHNLDILRNMRTARQIADAFLEDIPEDCTILRMHSSGDYFKRIYFEASLIFASERPDILTYAYTKMIPYWVDNKEAVNSLDNFRLVASMGGKYDRTAKRHGFRTCRVVLSPEQAKQEGVEIDHDDSYASGIRRNKHFAVLIHGTQPAGTEEGRAAYALRKAKLNGYRRSARGYGFREKRRTQS